MSNPNKNVVTAAGTGAYLSQMVVSGHLVYLSGVVAHDDTGKYVEGTIKDRTKAIFTNIQNRLKHVDLDLSDIVSVQIFLSKYTEDFQDMNEAYVACMPKPFPVRTCIGVANLPNGTDIEMTVIAAKRS